MSITLTLDYVEKVYETIDDDQIIYEIIQNGILPMVFTQKNINTLINDNFTYRPYNRYNILCRFISNQTTIEELELSLREKFNTMTLKQFLHTPSSELHDILNFYLENVPIDYVAKPIPDTYELSCEEQYLNLPINSMNPFYQTRQQLRDKIDQFQTEQVEPVQIEYTNSNTIITNRRKVTLAFIFDNAISEQYFPNDKRNLQTTRAVFYTLFQKMNIEPTQLITSTLTVDCQQQQEYYDREMSLKYQVGHLLYLMEMGQLNEIMQKNLIPWILQQREFKQAQELYPELSNLSMQLLQDFEQVIKSGELKVFNENLIEKLCLFSNLNVNIINEQVEEYMNQFVTLNDVNTPPILGQRYLTDCARLTRDICMNILKKYPTLADTLKNHSKTKTYPLMLNEIFPNECYFNIVQMLQIFKFVPSLPPQQINLQNNETIYEYDIFNLTENTSIESADELITTIVQLKNENEQKVDECHKSKGEEVQCTFRKPSGAQVEVNFRKSCRRQNISNNQLNKLRKIKNMCTFKPKEYQEFRNYLYAIDMDLNEDIPALVEYVCHGKDLIGLCVVAELYGRFYSREIAEYELGCAKTIYSVLSELTIGDLQQLDKLFSNTEIPYEPVATKGLNWQKVQSLYGDKTLRQVSTKSFEGDFRQAMKAYDWSEMNIPSIGDTMAVISPLTGKRRLLSKSEQYLLNLRRNKRVQSIRLLDLQHSLSYHNELTIIKYWLDNYNEWLSYSQEKRTMCFIILHLALLNSNTNYFNKCFLQKNLDKLTLKQCDFDIFEDIRFSKANTLQMFQGKVDTKTFTFDPNYWEFIEANYCNVSDETIVDLYYNWLSERSDVTIDKHLRPLSDYVKRMDSKVFQSFIVNYLNYRHDDDFE